MIVEFYRVLQFNDVFTRILQVQFAGFTDWIQTLISRLCWGIDDLFSTN